MNPESQPAERAQIAVVDDSEAVCRSLSLLLRSKGYGVSVFNSGVAFLGRGGGTQFDCILIDFKMSPHDGFDLLRELRAQGNTVPAIMITGWESNDIFELAKQEGFADVIYKPMLDDKLAEALERVLAH